ncbi:type II toxin-antitoxin system HigB family toxin [uncultured Draconibacterium sp.]|uniref:type II toxin-antitoxin system HigB family toxin n=1 Tax=uncultured Draconibacterium sp. TaxID=1573823 RepID=UPI0029C61BB9|nr:type II toxin-antitoxin system HigB family toxin [uncultured Draconibacterium sp.]
MRVITYARFRDASKKHPDGAAQFELLYRDLKSNVYENLNQVNEQFTGVSLLKDNRVVFNIHGNKYRVVVKFNFKLKKCFVRFVGTHAEYDKIDANTV